MVSFGKRDFMDLLLSIIDLSVIWEYLCVCDNVLRKQYLHCRIVVFMCIFAFLNDIKNSLGPGTCLMLL